MTLCSHLAAALAMLVGALLSAQDEPTRRPNFLFILADDQSPFDLGIYNPESTLETPVLTQLAADGMVIDGAYHMGSWSGAVCTPSRHMIMSGRTVWHLPRRGIRGEKQNPLCPPDLADQTMAAVFQRAGYDTMRTCKRGNSFEAANALFAVRRDKTCRQGDAENGSAWHAQQVLDYLAAREADEDRDPFLIYFGFSHPHDPRYGTPELLEKYGASDVAVPDEPNPAAPALPANYLPAHPFPHGHPGLRDEVSVHLVERRRDEATIRNELGREFACSENIDRQIGRVLDKLEAMGELDNTYVIYTADHGMAIGRHGLQGKQNLYEHTWRVPLIVRGPGIGQGQRAQGNIYLLDVLDTLCDLAGIDAPDTTEGISFRAVLEGRANVSREVLYGVYCGGTKPGMRAVRRGPWKLIEYDVLDGKVRETQLFHLGNNPDEFLAEHGRGAHLVNLAGDPEFSEQLAAMRALLLAEMKRLDDPYRLWNQPAR